MYAATSAPTTSSAIPPQSSSFARNSVTCRAKSTPSATDTPTQSADPASVRMTKRLTSMRITPASGGATQPAPGMNLPRNTVQSPQRSKCDDVCRTQESAESEMLQRRRSTRMP